MFFGWFRRKKKSENKKVSQYSIKNNWMYVDERKIEEIKSDSRKKYSSGNNICDYIVYHFTVSTTASSAHNTFRRPDTNVSWHITIDRSGNLYQLYDFRKRTWHAGRSSWTKPSGQFISGLNKYAIGIEMINAGPLSYDGSQFKTVYNQVIPESDVFIDENGKAWHSYTEAQIATALAITPVLCKKYKCVDVLDHEMISPGRKIDAGPAFTETLEKMRFHLRSGHYY